MIIIKADKHAITIKDNDRVTSFPLGCFIIRKDSNDEISLVSTISNDIFKCTLNQMTPLLTKFRKIDIPDSDDNKKGKEGDVCHSKSTGMYYLHNGQEYVPKSAELIIEIFMHKLISYLNGAYHLFNEKK